VFQNSSSRFTNDDGGGGGAAAAITTLKTTENFVKKLCAQKYLIATLCNEIYLS
jgi:hypothetical protein